MIQSSPSRFALVLMPATSEPASGSVTAEGADQAPVEGRGQPPCVLLGVAEVVDVQAGEVLVRAERRRHAGRAAARELLGDHRIGEAVGPGPADRLRVLHPEEAELADALEDLASGTPRPPPTPPRSRSSSFSTNERTDARSSSCSAVKRSRVVGGQSTVGRESQPLHPTDDLAHDFVGAAADADQARVAPAALDRELHRVAVARRRSAAPCRRPSTRPRR